MGEKVDVSDDFEIPEELEILFDKNHITKELMEYMNTYARMLAELPLDSDTIYHETHFLDAEKFTKINLEKIESYRKKYKDSLSTKGDLSNNGFSVNNLIQLADMYSFYIVLDHAYMEQELPTMYTVIHGNRKDPFSNISKENFRRFLSELGRNIWVFDDRYSTSFTRFLKGYYESL